MNRTTLERDQALHPAPRPVETDASTFEHKPHQSRPAEQPERGRVWNIERLLIGRALKMLGDPPIRLVLWNGERLGHQGEAPVACLTIRDRQTLWKLLVDPMFQFGEAYSNGRLEVEGDLTALIRSLDTVGKPGQKPLRQRLLDWWHKPNRTTETQSKHNIHHHYDIGNDFYKLWLDRQLVYTCAYFPQPGMSIEEAQIAKMDHVCRKLRLRPGEQVIEAGCGWGALGLHMARHYGVRVRAYNISHQQILYARQRAQAEGLDDRVEYIEDDWRNITGTCDKFVSVGMLEHVGRPNYARLGEVVSRCLKPDGLGLIHSIGVNWPRPFDAWIERRIFPGAYPPSLAEITNIFEPHDFSVLDVENLRLHYAETLRHWLARYEENIETIRGMFDETFVRAWRLYLAGSVAGFEAGRLQLFQILFAPGKNNCIPRSRKYQYNGGSFESDDLFDAPGS